MSDENKKLPAIFLRPQCHRRVMGGHPWIYSNEVVMNAAVRGIDAGIMVRFYAHDRRFIGTGTFNPHTLIAGRIINRNNLALIDETFVSGRIMAALALRQRLLNEPYYRLIHAEADGLPGLIVDRFGDYLCVQVNTAGMEQLWPVVQAALIATLKPKAIVLHTDTSSRALEGLENGGVKVVYGEVKEPIEVRENGVTFFADIVGGQKTGWYFDQRDNHALVAGYAKDAYVLDVYCHAGGFGLVAAAKGAVSVMGIDSSQTALDLAAKATERMGLTEKCQWVRGDVFAEMETLRERGKRFGVVVADPPPFVKSRKDLAAGTRGYRKLVRAAAMLVERGGMLFISSCSHNMTAELLTEAVAGGLQEAGRTGRILHSVGAAPDHPLHPHLPESGYLRGLLVWVE